jgi:hypothetical protein
MLSQFMKGRVLRMHPLYARTGEVSVVVDCPRFPLQLPEPCRSPIGITARWPFSNEFLPAFFHAHLGHLFVSGASSSNIAESI